MPDHDLLVLWIQLGSLLLAARLLGSLANRFGQPVVAGELAAGLLLGPSVFGHVWPGGFKWVFPASGGSAPLQALVAVSLAGLLVAIGAETDVALIRQLGRSAGFVATASLLVPMGAGIGLALALPPELHGRHGGTAPFVILIGGAVAVSSLPVIAKIVGDLGLMRRNLGQLAVATATTHDAVGFVMVALATGLAGSGSATGGSGGRVAVALIGVGGVSALVLTVGQRLFDSTLRLVRRHGPSVTGSLGVGVIGSLAAAAAMQAFGVEGALGAFVAGVALGRSRFQVGRAIGVLRAVTSTVLAPLYFSTAGLRVDLGALGRAPVAASFAALTAVALLAKLAGAAAGAGWAGRPRRESAALGVLLNGRGALQVVMATAGLALGVFNTASYTVVILMSVAGSLAVPPLLRLAIGGWEGTVEERDRLVREELMERNVVVRGQRLLLAARPGPAGDLAAQVLEEAWPPESPVTVLPLAAPDGAGQGLEADGGWAGREVDVLDHREGPIADRVLAEANLGYGVVAIGVSEEEAAGHLLSPALDDLLMRSPVPLIIVRRPQDAGVPAPVGAEGGGPALAEGGRPVLAPVSGNPTSRAGLEIACRLALTRRVRVVLAHVVTRGDRAPDDRQVDAAQAPPRRGVDAAGGAAQVVLRGAWDTALESGVEPEVLLRHGLSAGDEILAVAREVGAELIVLGAAVRHVENRPFLGHTVEQVLTHADRTVVVVALPEQTHRLGSVLAEAAGVA